jgi:hypothetical protein
LEAEIASERNRHETDRLALVQEQRLLSLAARPSPGRNG